ncbi:cytochrome P450 [Rhizophagus irregularis DAOM 181602=DAOM 197198]|nr:cytochrome P450 [Rhizophagus irregularis DAOM 181602=DAOM 197198]
MRAIVLCRGECIDDFLSKNTHGLRFHNFKGPEELGFEGKARITNHGCLTIIFLIKSYLMMKNLIINQTRVKDSLKLFQALRMLLMGYLIFFVISPFIRHYVPFFRNKADDVLQGMEFINQILGR